MYKETLPQDKTHANAPDSLNAASLREGLKVNRICDAFLKALASRASTRLQNIITSHVCKNPPDLEAGLLEVAKLQSETDTPYHKSREG